MKKCIKKPKVMTLIEFAQKYITEEKCCEDLFYRRFNDDYKCPKCDRKKGYKIETRYIWQCSKCGHQVSITAGTVFDNTKIGLQKWYFASYLIASSKGGISAKELQHQIGVTYKTAWYINRRLREVMQLSNDKYKLSGIVTMDECYYSSRENVAETSPKRGRGTNKSKAIVAVSLTESGNPKYARIEVVNDFKAKTIEKFAVGYIEKGSKIITDGFKAYQGQKLKNDYFVDYDVVPAQSSDSKLKWLHTVISNSKAFILGTFHGLKPQDLQLYLDEFCYRFNRRFIPDLTFNKLIDAAIETPSIGYYCED
jgi:ribosomal protein L37AE/L43A/transposase-like protein